MEAKGHNKPNDNNDQHKSSSEKVADCYEWSGHIELEPIDPLLRKPKEEKFSAFFMDTTQQIKVSNRECSCEEFRRPGTEHHPEFHFKTQDFVVRCGDVYPAHGIFNSVTGQESDKVFFNFQTPKGHQALTIENFTQSGVPEPPTMRLARGSDRYKKLPQSLIYLCSIYCSSIPGSTVPSPLQIRTHIDLPAVQAVPVANIFDQTEQLIPKKKIDIGNVNSRNDGTRTRSPSPAVFSRTATPIMNETPTGTLIVSETPTGTPIVNETPTGTPIVNEIPTSTIQSAADTAASADAILVANATANETQTAAATAANRAVTAAADVAGAADANMTAKGAVSGAATAANGAAAKATNNVADCAAAAAATSTATAAETVLSQFPLPDKDKGGKGDDPDPTSLLNIVLNPPGKGSQPSSSKRSKSSSSAHGSSSILRSSNRNRGTVNKFAEESVRKEEERKRIAAAKRLSTKEANVNAKVAAAVNAKTKPIIDSFQQQRDDVREKAERAERMLKEVQEKEEALERDKVAFIRLQSIASMNPAKKPKRSDFPVDLTVDVSSLGATSTMDCGTTKNTSNPYASEFMTTTSTNMQSTLKSMDSAADKVVSNVFQSVNNATSTSMTMLASLLNSQSRTFATAQEAVVAVLNNGAANKEDTPAMDVE